MIIVLIILGYLVIGFGVAMIYAFAQKRMGTWDKYSDSSFCIVLIFFYPCLVPTGIILFMFTKTKEFFEWFTDCINEKET